MKRVLVLGTGGTIVSETSENGLQPNENSMELNSIINSFRNYYEIEFRNILNLDSSNIQSEEWQLIAKTVFDYSKNFDGIIITHGTDTLAYTASMLSYMLQNLHIPVILTGSQLPIHLPLSDAKTNIATAFSAIDDNIIGVNIAFNYKIIKGTRAVKVRTMGFNAFESINYPLMSEIFADERRLFFKDITVENENLVLKSEICNDVFLLKLIPGTNPEIFDFIIKSKYRGIVIEAFGAGGLHYLRRDLLSKVKEMIGSNISVVVCSQCLYEHSDLSIYEPGKLLLSTGVISAKDMTTEATVTKLMWALGQTKSIDGVKKIFETNYVDEVTLR